MLAWPHDPLMGSPNPVPSPSQAFTGEAEPASGSPSTSLVRQKGSVRRPRGHYQTLPLDWNLRIFSLSGEFSMALACHFCFPVCFLSPLLRPGPWASLWLTLIVLFPGAGWREVRHELGGCRLPFPALHPAASRLASLIPTCFT